MEPVKEEILEAFANTKLSDQQYKELKDEIEKHYTNEIKYLKDKVMALEKLLVDVVSEINKYDSDDDSDDDCDCDKCNSTSSSGELPSLEDIPDLKTPTLERQLSDSLSASVCISNKNTNTDETETKE